MVYMDISWPDGDQPGSACSVFRPPRPAPPYLGIAGGISRTITARVTDFLLLRESPSSSASWSLSSTIIRLMLAWGKPHPRLGILLLQALQRDAHRHV